MVSKHSHNKKHWSLQTAVKNDWNFLLAFCLFVSHEQEYKLKSTCFSVDAVGKGVHQVKQSS